MSSTLWTLKLREYEPEGANGPIKGAWVCDIHPQIERKVHPGVKVKTFMVEEELLPAGVKQDDELRLTISVGSSSVEGLSELIRQSIDDLRELGLIGEKAEVVVGTKELREQLNDGEITRVVEDLVESVEGLLEDLT